MEKHKTTPNPLFGNALSRLAIMATALSLTTAGCKKEETVVTEQPAQPDIMTPPETTKPIEIRKLDEPKNYRSPADIRSVISALCDNIFANYPSERQFIYAEDTETLMNACNSEIVSKENITCDDKQCLVYDGNTAYPVNYKVEYPKLDKALSSYGYKIANDAKIEISKDIQIPLDRALHIPSTGLELEKICQPMFRQARTAVTVLPEPGDGTTKRFTPTPTPTPTPLPTPGGQNIRSREVEHGQAVMNYNELLLNQ
jgi:hypothetical protein